MKLSIISCISHSIWPFKDNSNVSGPSTTLLILLAGLFHLAMAMASVATASACFLPTCITKTCEVCFSFRTTYPRTRSWSTSTCRLHFSQPNEASSSTFSVSRDCLKLQIARAQPEGTAEEVNSDVAERERESVAALTVGVVAPEVSSDAIEAAIATAANPAVGSSYFSIQVFLKFLWNKWWRCWRKFLKHSILKHV